MVIVEISTLYIFANPRLLGYKGSDLHLQDQHQTADKKPVPYMITYNEDSMCGEVTYQPRGHSVMH
jgi:hypothetical protein